MIETYYNEHERQRMKTTSDAEINELLKEINDLVGDRLFISEFEITPRRGFFSSWFNSQKPIKVYGLYRHLDGSACQVVNFAQDHDWSINTSVRKSYILTYLYGIASGYSDAIKFVKQQLNP